MKFFSSRFLFICSLSLFSYSSTFSQQSFRDTNSAEAYQNALELYQNKAYTSAQQTFANFAKTSQKNSILQSNASYYEAMCAVFLNQKNAEAENRNYL